MPDFEKVAHVLAKLAPYYEKWHRRGGGSYIVEQNALRYIRIRKEFDKSFDK